MNQPIEERREDYLPSGRLDQIQKTLIEQQIVTSRLVVVSENQSKSIEGLENWIEKHDEKYHMLDADMRETKMIVSNWSTQLSEVKDQLKSLAAGFKQINDVGLKVRGGWVVFVFLGGVVLGVIGLAVGMVLKANGVI